MSGTTGQILTPINIGFLLSVMILFFMSVIKIIKNPKEYSTLPNVIAALGIIGTFLGIFLGLLDFNTNDINGSIPKLLDGMKTAFFTSLIGLSLSNILKSFQSQQLKKVIKMSERDAGEISLEKIAGLMLDIKESLVGSNKELVKAIVEMKENDIKTSSENRKAMKILVESLTGNTQESLVSQMKSLKESMIQAQKEAQDRLSLGLGKMEIQLNELVKTNNSISTEIERGNNVLIEEFKIFSKNMAENNMKAFTDAIQDCIKDLNNQLQEQFGENFKHLNLAVEKLLEWQIHYKETVEKATENQIEIYKGMSKAQDLVVDINERSLSIVEVANRLGDKIVTFDTQQKTLNNSIQILNKISKEAIDLVPNLDNYLSTTKSTVIETSKDIEKLTKVSTNNIESQQLQIVEALNNLTNKLNGASELNIEAIESQIFSLEKAAVKFENEGFTLTKKISDNIQVMVENNNSNLQASIQNINELLSTTLNTSLQSLGEQLASVSEKFVSDYTPLTIELQKLVNLSKKAGL